MPVCQDVQCGINLVGHISDTSFWNGYSKPQIIFFLKSRLVISKDQVNRMFSLEKIHCFLKVLTTFYKKISEMIKTLELWEYENTAYLLKKLKSFNATWLITNCSFSYQIKLFFIILLGIRTKHSAYPLSEIFFSS